MSRLFKSRPFTAFFRFFLAGYEGSDFLIREKARVLCLILLAILLVIIPAFVALFASLRLDQFHRVVIFSFAGIVPLLLFVLRQGHFRIASHGFLLIAFASLWSTFFYDIGAGDLRLIERLSTITLVLTLLTLTPLIVAQMKHAIFGYYVLNFAVFAVFILMLKDRAAAPAHSILSYAVDVSMGFVLSGVISYNIFRINQNAIGRATAAEDATRKREELFRGIIKESPQSVAIVNPDGSLEFPGNVRSTIFGYTADLIPTLDRWWELAYPDPDYRTLILTEWNAIIRDSASGKPAKSIETKILTLQGEIRDIMIRYVPLDSAGRGLILLDDVTNRRIIERSLLASERRYQNLYDSMLDGFVSCDMEGYIIEFNRTFMEMTGHSRSELHRMTIWELTPPRWHEQQRKMIRDQMLTQGHTELFEKEYIRKDGTPFPVELRLYLIRDDGGGPAGYWSIVHDISRRKQTEQELLKASKIESIGVFAGGIAHDFNNLLTAIVGNISIAKMDSAPGSRTVEILAEAEKASERAKDLTMQLLTFSKGGAPIKKITSIRELVVETTEFALRGSPVGHEIVIPPDLWNAEIDPGQISQVIHNLVLNAREAMPEGGTVTITAENRTIESGSDSPFIPGEYISLTIRDTGSGIPRPHHTKVFDPFFSTKKDGSGLGLSVTYSIVKKHGGYISVESDEGAGAIFTILLPATEQKAVARENHGNGASLGTGRVLLMDDDEMVLSVGKRILERMGFRTSVARDGREAVDLYRDAAGRGDPFRLVIMDLTVPGGMGGKEAVRILREFDPGVKAVVSSGYSNDPVMSRYGDYGFSGVVTKPYTYDDLLEVLRGIEGTEREA